MSNELRVTSFTGTNPLIVRSKTLQNTRYYSKHRIYVELKHNIVLHHLENKDSWNASFSLTLSLIKQNYCLVFKNASWAWIVDRAKIRVFIIVTNGPLTVTSGHT